ncbi:MAG: penicillin acylase family protein [Acidimicrobiia bacterium]|nr:penicillin acylase family protein [Acidimicrobiia bacterium]
MTEHPARRGRYLLALALVFAVIAAACSSDGDGSGDSAPEPESSTSSTAAATQTTASGTPGQTITEDRAHYILPPGNYGGIPTNDDSLDQLPLYDGLTPLRGDVTDADIDQYFLPQNFEPVGETSVEETGREGLEILYDEYGIPHITGETREDVAFGAGWVTGRDRSILLDFGRGPARAAVADIPGIDAFSLVTSATSYVPSAAVEQMVTDQIQLILDTYAEEGEEIISDAQAYADGVNAYWEANDPGKEPATVNDVIATTAFIGSIFGAGGGSEAANAEFLSALQSRLGDEQGRLAWDDLMQTDDPEAPTTIEETFDYGTFTGGDVVGSAVIDDGSIISLDPREPTEGSAPVVGVSFAYEAAGDPPARQASNWLTVNPDESVNGTTLAVMGPQLGYYYPEIVMQMHLSGPGIEAQGAAVPGLAMYLLIGRTQDYAWSLTSANQDVRDVFVEVLCEPDGSPPTRESGSYLHDGACTPFESFDAGTLGGVPITYPVSVHGNVIGTATSEGAPVALTRQRSTFGRDGLNLGALKDMTEGDAATVEDFWEVANQFGFTFNWGYANREDIGYFASGYLPVRAEGLDRRLPTLGTGEYEWQDFLSQDEHPHADGHPSGRLLNWNNQSAPGWMHGDGNQYGSWHRVENFDQWPEQATLADVVSVMNRAATEDTLAPVWPVVSEVLAAGEAPSELAAQTVEILDTWVADDAPLLDADEDGDWDEPGALLMGELFGPILEAALDPVFESVRADDIELRGIEEASMLDKDLRTLLGQSVEGAFNLQYCGLGDLDECAASLWAAIDVRAGELAGELGDDPTTWRREGLRSDFVPGLIDTDFRSTNRPTYQQVLEFAPPS